METQEEAQKHPSHQFQMSKVAVGLLVICLAAVLALSIVAIVMSQNASNASARAIEIAESNRVNNNNNENPKFFSSLTVDTDDGTAVSNLGNTINIIGKSNQIETSGTDNTIAIGIPDTFSIGSLGGDSKATIMSGTGGTQLYSNGIIEIAATDRTIFSGTSTTFSSEIKMDAKLVTIVSPTTTGSGQAYNPLKIILDGFTTPSEATQVITITDLPSYINGDAVSLMYGCSNSGTQDARMSIQKVMYSNPNVLVTLVNNGPEALNGRVTVTLFFLNTLL